MANWVKCTRKVDNEAVYVNFDTAERLRWNDTDECTVVVWPGGKDNFIRILEHPDDIFENDVQPKKLPRPRAQKQES